MRSALSAVGLAVCLAQATAPSPRQWTEVRSPDDGFRVEFPSAATRRFAPSSAASPLSWSTYCWTTGKNVTLATERLS